MTCDRCGREATLNQTITWPGGSRTLVYRCAAGHTTVRSEGE